MMGENSFDFDFGIDDFLDLLVEEPETRGLPGQQNTKQSTQEQKQENKQEHKQEESAKRNNLQARLRVMKNDIRRYYSRMLMNTINSGDFNHLQGYFSTFMTGNTKFLVNYDNFDPVYRIPPRLWTSGPKLMSHYFLGILVMYPDVVMHMENTVITTSNTWSGTKIEMDVAFDATKAYALSDAEWIPQLDTLEGNCSKLAEEKNTHVLQVCPAPGRDDSSRETRRKRPEGGASGSNGSYCPSSSSSLSSYASASSRRSVVETRHSPGGPFLATNEDMSTAGKRKRPPPGALNALSKAHTDRTGKVLSPESTVSQSNNGNHALISDDYVRALCAQATLVPSPLRVSMKGKMTMFLDENNHILHMNMTVSQI